MNKELKKYLRIKRVFIKIKDERITMKKIVTSVCIALLVSSSLFGKKESDFFKFTSPTDDKKKLAAYKKDFEDLTNVSFTKSFLASDKRKIDRKKDLQYLQCAMLYNFTDLIKQLLLNSDKIEDEDERVLIDEIQPALEDYFKKAKPSDLLKVQNAYKYAVADFEQKLLKNKDDIKIVIDNLDKDVQVSIEKLITIVNDAIETSNLNKNYAQVLKAMGELKVTVEPKSLTLKNIKILNQRMEDIRMKEAEE